tara:strand:- start:843 stop:1136 length:294 start_codon:yes stop_codon:yes gene_type:complete
MKHIYHRVRYVEDAIVNKLQKHPSSELGRDLLFVRFFRVRLNSRLAVNTKNWYPINVEDYISWQLTQFELWQKEGKISMPSKGDMAMISITLGWSWN